MSLVQFQYHAFHTVQYGSLGTSWSPLGAFMILVPYHQGSKPLETCSQTWWSFLRESFSTHPWLHILLCKYFIFGKIKQLLLKGSVRHQKSFFHAWQIFLRKFHDPPWPHILLCILSLLVHVPHLIPPRVSESLPMCFPEMVDLRTRLNVSQNWNQSQIWMWRVVRGA